MEINLQRKIKEIGIQKYLSPRLGSVSKNFEGEFLPSRTVLAFYDLSIDSNTQNLQFRFSGCSKILMEAQKYAIPEQSNFLSGYISKYLFRLGQQPRSNQYIVRIAFVIIENTYSSTYSVILSDWVTMIGHTTGFIGGTLLFDFEIAFFYLPGVLKLAIFNRKAGWTVFERNRGEPVHI